MRGHFEYFHFSHGGLLGVLLLVRLFEFFDSDVDLGLDVAAFEHHSIGSLPNSRQNLVFLH
jgi:hypothetical protein